MNRYCLLLDGTVTLGIGPFGFGKADEYKFKLDEDWWKVMPMGSHQTYIGIELLDDVGDVIASNMKYNLAFECEKDQTIIGGQINVKNEITWKDGVAGRGQAIWLTEEQALYLKTVRITYYVNPVWYVGSDHNKLPIDTGTDAVLHGRAYKDILGHREYLTLNIVPQWDRIPISNITYDITPRIAQGYISTDEEEEDVEMGITIKDDENSVTYYWRNDENPLVNGSELTF